METGKQRKNRGKESRGVNKKAGGDKKKGK